MYAKRASTEGSAALDFERLGMIPEIPYEGEPRTYPKRKEKEKVREETEQRTKVKTRVRRDNGQKIVPSAVLGYLCAGFMLVLVLMSYIQLTVISDQTVELKSDLTQLEEEASKLAFEYESAFGLKEIEKYAKEELGMIEPASSQIYYVESSLKDEAVVLADEGGEESKNILSGVISFLGTFMEYFK